MQTTNKIDHKKHCPRKIDLQTFFVIHVIKIAIKIEM